MEVRHCYECDQDKPLSAEFFLPRPRNTPPFAEVCRSCQNALAKHRKQIIAEQLPTLLEKIEAYSIDVISSDALSDGNNIPHSAELLEAVMAAFGGVENLGKLMAAHFWQSKPGQAQRTKILTSIAALIVKNVDQGGAKKPLELWTEEELQAEYQKRVQQEAKQLRIADGTVRNTA